jgi:CubicO group peptidase (beta-lactamase class C family)
MNKAIKIIALLVISISMFLPIECFGFSDTDYVYRNPSDINDGIETESMYKTDIDYKIIIELIENIKTGGYKNIHSLLIVKDGKLIIEEYFHGFHQNKVHEIRSASKSIGSILTGIAIDKGFIKNADEKIYPYFKNYTLETKWGSLAKDVSIKSLLTMTSGYKCDDHSLPSFQCETAMYKSNDWVEYALNLAMEYKPLEHFAYNSTSLILVSEIISKTSTMPIPDFADTYLFKPLGINEFHWGFSPKKRAFIAGNSKMKPRDMLKIGLLMLNNGKWGNRQIISEKWIKESTTNHINPKNHKNYGYLWWLGSHVFGKQIIKGYWAAGNGGNYIFVCPKLNLVAVFTGGNYSNILEIQPLGMMINYIIPSILPPVTAPHTIKLDPEIMDSCTGEYKQKSGNLLINVYKKKGKLFCNILEKSSQLYPVKNDLFFVPDKVFGNWTFKVIRNKKNKVVSAVGYAAFQTIPFRKLR